MRVLRPAEVADTRSRVRLLRHFTTLLCTWIPISQNWFWALSLQNYSSTLIFKTESSTAVSRFPQNCAFKTILYCKIESSCSIPSLFRIPKLIPATLIHSTNCKPLYAASLGRPQSLSSSQLSQLLSLQ